MEFVIGAILIGIATGWLAQSKGRNFFGWWLLGTLLPIIGLILAATVPRVERNLDRREIAHGDRKKCPYCAELVRTDALVCRFCGRNLERASEPSAATMDADTLASIRASEMQSKHD